MKTLKRYWPILLILIAWAAATLLLRWLDDTYIDALTTGLTGIFLFCVIFPILFLILSVRCGIGTGDPKKWLLVPILGVADVLMPMVSIWNWDITAFWWFFFFGAVPALIGLWIGGALRKRAQR